MFAGQATFDGIVSRCDLPVPVVAGMLRSDLELVPGATRTDQHPIVFLLGGQSDVRLHFGGASFPLDVHYREFLLGIPWVRRKGEREAGTWVPRMFSSYFPTVWNGTQHYGLGKQLGEIERRGHLFLLTDASGALLLHVQTGTSEEWLGGDADPPGWAEIRAFFELPILGFPPSGRPVSTRFVWDLARAALRPTDCTTVVDTPFVKGLPAGAYPDAAQGSFAVRDMVWCIGWPERV